MDFHRLALDVLRLRVDTSEQAANSEGHDHRDSADYKQGVRIVDRTAAMMDLLVEARPIVAGKRCSYRWCLEGRGEITDNPAGPSRA